MSEAATTILIVDDNPIGRLSVESTLTDRGYHLVFAASGAEALSRAADTTPDLILLDVMMPDMDGFEVCRRLRSLPALMEVPIILLTALDDHASKLAGLEAGADAFISKPLDGAELRAQVRTITRLNRYRNLWAERAKLESLTALSPDGILVVDAGGLIRFSNTAGATLLGIENSPEVVGRRLLDFVDGAWHATVLGTIEQVRSQPGAQAQLEAEFMRTDGAVVPAEARVGRVLWAGEPMAQVILRDITERRRLQAIVRANQQDLQNLLRRLVAVQEAERRFLAVELHDEIGQGLTGLKLLLETSALLPEVELRAGLKEAQALSRELLGHVRELSLDLRPAMLDDVGLFAALDWLCDRFGRQTKITIARRFEALETRRFAPEVETAAFRIVQEALTNVARHAAAVDAEVQVSTDKTVLRVTIKDGGSGFDPGVLRSREHPSSGLTGMRERARSVDGEVTVISAPGRGTIVEAVFPIAAERQEG